MIDADLMDKKMMGLIFIFVGLMVLGLLVFGNKSLMERSCRIMGIPSWCEGLEIWDCEPAGSPFGAHCHRICSSDGDFQTVECVFRRCALNPELVWEPGSGCPSHLH